MSPAGAPTFVVAGAARAGSTAVVEALRRHRDVFVCQPKEPHYLALGGQPAVFSGPGDAETINRAVVVDEVDYLAMFLPGREHAARGEGSVSTLYYAGVAGPRLHRLNSGARIVLVLREPVARAFSSHQYLRNRGIEPEADLLRAVAAEQERIAAGWHHLWHYTTMSRYAEAVGQFRDVFGPDQVGVWWYDDLTADFTGTLNAIQRFIGVTPWAMNQQTTQRVNASGAPRSARLQSALQAVSGTPMLRRVGKRVVPFSVRERIRRANLAPSAPSGDVRAALAPLFTEDLGRLEDLLGRSVPTGWNHSAPG